MTAKTEAVPKLGRKVLLKLSGPLRSTYTGHVSNLIKTYTKCSEIRWYSLSTSAQHGYTDRSSVLPHPERIEDRHRFFENDARKRREKKVKMYIDGRDRVRTLHSLP